MTSAATIESPVTQAASHQATPPGWATAVGRALTPTPLRGWVKSVCAEALDWLTLGRGMARRLPEGEIVRVAPQRRFMAWNLDEYQAFRKATTSGAVVLDVGANAGAYSMLFGQWAGVAGQVFAFEPSPQVFRALRRHVALNKLDRIVEAVPAAVGDLPGRATLSTGPADGMHRLGADPNAGAVEVAVITLDAFCDERGLRPTVVKIDVEGFELQVLRGARETLRRVGAGLEVFVEIHPTLWPEVGYTREDLEAELARQGLAFEPLLPGQPIWTVEGMCLRLVRNGRP